MGAGPEQGETVMHFEKRYDMETLAGRNAAYADAKDWLGDKRFALLERAIKSGEIETMAQLRFACSFAGLEGAPVTALAEKNGLYE